MLSIKNLYSGYGKLRVLYDVNVEVPKKEITVIVGPNGAGKTTLLNSILGFADVFSGKIYLDGKEITGTPAHRVAQLGISFVPQLGNIFANLTLKENLIMAAYTLPKKEVDKRMEQVLEMFPVIKEFFYRKAGTLSGGERRMLSIGMGLMRNPKIMLLDEPSTDLAPLITKEVMRTVKKLRDELGLTVLLVEQMAKLALDIGDNAYLLVSGQIKFKGKAKELLQHPELSKLYLGIKE